MRVLTLCALLVGCSSGSEDERPPRGGEPGGEGGIVTSAFCEGIVTPPKDPPRFYEDNPTLPDANDSGAGLVYSDPAAQGMDGGVLEGAASELSGKPFVHSLVVMRHGAVVMERYFNGSAPGDSNAIHSSSKSMLAMLVGIAIEEGHIAGVDQPVSELAPDLFEGVGPEVAGITVGQLLTMSAGFEWREDVSEYQLQNEPNWIGAIVDLPLETEPGAKFNYSTCQSHLMGAVLAHATGSSLCDYAHDKLLRPIGAEAERWGRDPQGYFSGGYNVTMSPLELLRFGQLVVDRGSFGGVQVVPADWVDASVDEQIVDGGAYWYGYYFWLFRPPGEELDIAWGYGGQLVYTVPDHDVVVVITTNTSELDPDYDGGQLVLDHVIAAIVD